MGPWLSLPRPCPKGSGHPHSQWGRGNFLKTEGGRDRDRKLGEKAEVGRAEDSGAPGRARQSQWGQVSPAIRQAHPLGLWKAPSGWPTHIPRGKNTSKQHTTMHTETYSEDPHPPQMCNLHRRAHTYRHISLCLAACHSPPALAHYQSSSQQSPPGAHACCHLLAQTFQGPAGTPSIIQERGCQPWI